jgi:transposase-like protein
MMLCPYCNSDDVDLVQEFEKREWWFCWKCRRGFYVNFLYSRKRK